MKTYTEQELITFGNYLLSNSRKKNIRNKVNISNVTDSDISNFQYLTKSNKSAGKE